MYMCARAHTHTPLMILDDERSYCSAVVWLSSVIQSEETYSNGDLHQAERWPVVGLTVCRSGHRLLVNRLKAALILDFCLRSRPWVSPPRPGLFPVFLLIIALFILLPHQSENPGSMAWTEWEPLSKKKHPSRKKRIFKFLVWHWAFLISLSDWDQSSYSHVAIFFIPQRLETISLFLL